MEDQSNIVAGEKVVLNDNHTVLQTKTNNRIIGRVVSDEEKTKSRKDEEILGQQKEKKQFYKKLYFR